MLDFNSPKTTQSTNWVVELHYGDQVQVVGSYTDESQARDFAQEHWIDAAEEQECSGEDADEDSQFSYHVRELRDGEVVG